MAEVFLAQDREKKVVVIKKILPHLASQPEYLRMFREELNILSSLKHENIVQVIKTHSEYVVMEYLDGYDWRFVLQNPVPFPIVAHLFLEALRTLQYVHSCKIIHRDISPQNWILTYDGKVKLLDFGISKSETGSDNTVTGILKGKYSYMSPEQASGEKITIHSDIFSIGVMLFESCTQTRLFKRSNDLLTLQAISACEVKIPENIPTELGSICLKALAKKKEDRFQSCEELRAVLLEYAKKNNQIVSREEVVQFINGLPKPKNHVLFEVTQIKRMKNNLFWAGVIALYFCFLGLGFEERQYAPVQTEEFQKPMGRLKIIATPWARVYLNGDYIGSTPMAVRSLAEGVYRVHLENPEISKNISREITIQSGKDTLLRQNW